MATVKPFGALRYDLAGVDIKKVIMPPYDIIKDTKEYYSMSPHNIVRIDKGEELPGDAGAENKYTRAASFMKEWIEKGILKKEDKECFYVYRQEYTLPDGKKKEMTGFFASVKIEEFEKRIILPHERTHSGPKADRLELMRATKSNTSPILSLYFDREKKIHTLLEKAAKAKPFMDFADDKGIRYRMWKVEAGSEAEKIEKLMSDKQLFIADGHHRYETAMNFRNEMRVKSPSDARFDSIMMCLISMEHSGISILPTHRIKHKWNREKFEEDPKVEKYFKIKRVKNAADVRKIIIAPDHKKIIGVVSNTGCFTLELNKAEYKKALERRERSAAYYMLDVSVLHGLLFADILKMDDAELFDGLEYTPDIDEAINAVVKGGAKVSFLIKPSTVEEVKEISLNNETMPQKSTYFLPKLATGFLINKMD